MKYMDLHVVCQLEMRKAHSAKSKDLDKFDRIDPAGIGFVPVK